MKWIINGTINFLLQNVLKKSSNHQPDKFAIVSSHKLNGTNV